MSAGRPSRLVTRAYWGDSVTSFEFRADRNNAAILYVQGRYALPLPGNGEWQHVAVRFRAPRFDAGGNKIQNALQLDVSVGAETLRNVVIPKYSEQPHFNWEDSGGPTVIEIGKGTFELRNFLHERADFAEVEPPSKTGAETNEGQLVDSVALGKKAFEAVGCNACHLIDASDGSAGSGPNLFGLFGVEPRTREIVEGDEGHRFQIKASREYLQRSVRTPAAQLAVAEGGTNKGNAYLPVMPAFTKDVVSDEQIAYIGDYLATLNEPLARGPVMKLVKLAPAVSYDPMTDNLQWLVGDTVRVQRGPMGGVSARSIHVGNPDGVNYTFDPRILAIAKIWQGGFLDMAGELKNRGGNGLALGYESRELDFGKHEYLLAPLDTRGRAIDFSFKEGKFGDLSSHRAALYSKADHADMIAAAKAQFLGYSRDSRDPLAAPIFRYQVGENVIEIQTKISSNGDVEISVHGALKQPQTFAMNPALLKNAITTTGSLRDDVWSVPAGETHAVLRGSMNVAASAWRPAQTRYGYRRAPITKEAASAKLPTGYSIENLYPPKDNYGREQLFEALGLSQSGDGTVVVATRTAGIWRLVSGEWRLFAEGLFDCLGVVAEDQRGLTVVASQKAELTRISDTNGDGVADKYETLFDAHSYHGNYHSYMHGPVRGKDGAYYIALNLAADGGNSTYNANGKYMGSWGGYSGWAIRVEGVNRYQLFASGLRSPAGLGASPDGRLWFLDNQGEYVGTSKMFELKKGRFYSHPVSLIDLPGMTPDSPEIAWENWIDRREKAAVLFPHNRVANSPGSPAWIPKSAFGAFAGQIVVGDQTQSNLLRVVLQEVDGVQQASVVPFFEGLESGVMRPLFLQDGSLLLGQTGRGWQAKGGKVTALQQVRWDGITVAPQIVAMLASPQGFHLDLTQPLREKTTEQTLRAAMSLESWTYRDAPDYGSDELDVHAEDVASISLSVDRRRISVRLASTVQRKVHLQQSARVYRATLKGPALFDGAAPTDLSAYYTLYRFPEKPASR
ncbi:MAG: c-type cytochrome [Steroidobacteraceae bacterium]|nr:c-type cytochrome [Steroidobacteraceae bacterium]